MADLSVLIVDDEESFIEAIVVGLEREGFVVTAARNGSEALELFERLRPDLVLLDVQLPGKSGIEVCREIRAHSQVPIIMVSAKTSEVDTVVGLEVGADDYVTKPYRLGELLARMRAVLRRSPRGAESDTGGTIEGGGLRLDPGSHEVQLRGTKVTMPLKEFALLELLMSNAGRVLSRDTIVGRVWGPNYRGDAKTLDVHVTRLRSKIEDDPSCPARIITIRGVGYRFELSPLGPDHTPS